MQSVSEAQLEVYRQTMRRREALRISTLQKRVAKAQLVSQQAADWLRQTYGVGQVWLFGSLVRPQWFTMTSDIDLAIAQLSPANYLIAIAHLQDLSPDFKIDLVQLERISASFSSAIITEGKRL
ncbi:MAG: nucleotidyltransferase domain-containing protein [Phormidesmis sp.]